jgi:plasmid replication initiation protein
MALEAKVNTVVRHNTLIEGEYNLTLEELRIWAMIVSEIDKNDTNFKATYRIYPREYIKLSGTKSKSVYADLRSALKRLRDQELRMKIKKNGETGTLVTGFISSVFYNDNNSYFDVSFDPQLKPFLIELKNEFTIMNLDTLFMFSSSYSVRIYELLKQYQKIGTREFKVSELRRILNCTSVYPSYGDFKRRVIAKAQKDMDQSGDLKFEFSEVKKGRSVHKLVFHIWKKSDEKDGINQLSDPEDAEKEEVINHLLVAGIAQNQARRFADKHPAQDI